MVYRLQVPGHLSAPVKWTGRPTLFEFAIGADHMTVKQDDNVIGKTRLPPGFTTGKGLRVRWSDGIHGPLRGEIRDRRFGPSNVN